MNRRAGYGRQRGVRGSRDSGPEEEAGPGRVRVPDRRSRVKAAGRRGSRVWGPGSGVLGPGRAAPGRVGLLCKGWGAAPRPGAAWTRGARARRAFGPQQGPPSSGQLQNGRPRRAPPEGRLRCASPATRGVITILPSAPTTRAGPVQGRWGAPRSGVGTGVGTAVEDRGCPT